MARRDVDLVIRAKDEAESVVKNITTALNGFIDAQNGLQSEASGTEGSLQSLGAALGQLDKAIASLSGGSDLTKKMARAADSVDRLKEQISSAEGELTDLGQSFRGAASQADRLGKKLAGAKAVQENYTASTREARSGTRGLATDYAKVEAATQGFETKLERLSGKLVKAQGDFDAASAKVAGLRDDVASTESPTKKLTESLARAERGLEKKAASVGRLRAEYEGLQSESRAAASAASILAGQHAAAEAELARQEAILGKVAANVRELSASYRAASSETASLEGKHAKATAALKRQTEQLDRAEASYVSLADVAAGLDDQISRAGSQSRGGLEQQLVDQAMAVQRTKAEVERLTRVSEGYARTMLAAGPPTREVSQRVQLLGQRAEEARFELMAQEEALAGMGATLRATGDDIGSVTQAQARFIAEQDKLKASLREVAEDSLRERNAIRQTHKEAEAGAQSFRRLASEKRRAATESGGLAAAYRSLYGDTRKSLSYTQRLRGEVLSLIAAYGGLYGVIELLRGVTTAYQTMEAAQSRLGVAFGGDLDATAQEMDFLQRTAARLGVSMGDLSTEYSKFAIATQGTELAGENTRKIFLAVAEAARVNRSTTEEMQGVFTALTQIVSKGAVQMEELRQQLGDRLPGALQIMASGLNVSTARLIEMMEAGEVTSAALVPFAEELKRRFGPELGEALQSNTVAMGRFKNAVFNAAVAFGRAGFIEALSDLANKLTEVLESADFTALMGRLAGAASVLLETLGVLAENFDLVVAAGAAFLGIKLAPLLIYLAIQTDKAAAAAVRGSAAFVKFGVSARSAGASAATAAVGVGRVTTAMRALASATAAGLAITAISAGIGLWASRADEASQALKDHERTVDDVRDAYDAVGGSVDDWKQSVDTLTRSEAEANLRRVEGAVSDLAQQFRLAAEGNDSIWTNFFGYNLRARAAVFSVSKAYKSAVGDIVDSFEDGTTSADDLLGELEDVNKTFSDGSKENALYAEFVIKTARALLAGRDALEESRKILRAHSDDTGEAQDAFDELGNSAKKTVRTLDEIAGEKAAKFSGAMAEMAEGVETVNEELAYLEASEAINKLGREAIANASNLDELAAALTRIKAAQDSLGEEYVSKAVSGSLVDRIIGVESGGDPSAKNPKSTATGLGQFIESTWLRMFKQYFPDRAEGMSRAAILALREDADVSRSMVELYLRENAENLMRAGQAVTDANLYLSHFLGPGGALALIQSAPGTSANAVLSKEQVAANASILDGKTREEVIAWAQRKVGVSEQELSAAEAVNDALRDQREEAAKAARESEEAAARRAAATRDRISDADFEIEQQKLINSGKEREAEIARALREARSENPDLSQAEADRIRAQTNALIDLEEANEAAKEAQQLREDAAEEAAKAAEDAAEALRKQRDATSELIGENAFEIEQQKLIIAGRERQAAIEDAIRSARKDNPNITDAEVRQIEGQVNALYDLAAAEEAAEAAAKAAEDAADRAAAGAEDTSDRVSENEFLIAQQRLINAGKEREAAIEEAVRRAREGNVNITDAQVAKIREQTGALYDLQAAEKTATTAREQAKEAEEEMNLLLEYRNALEEQWQLARSAGDTTLQESLRLKMAEINAELLAAIANAREMWAAVGGTEADLAIAKLDSAQMSAQKFGEGAKQSYIEWDQVQDLLVNGLTNAFDSFAQAVANGEDAGKAARNAFLQFASDFLLQIAQMIMKQAILNALQGIFGGGVGGVPVGAAHTGGVVGSARAGSGNQTRRVSPGLFASAARYHVGGIVGLRPGEVPIVAKQGEEVLTRDDPRHMLNGGGGGQQAATSSGTRVVNAFDGTSFLEEALKTRAGEEVLLNYVSANRNSVRAMLGI